MSKAFYNGKMLPIISSTDKFITLKENNDTITVPLNKVRKGDEIKICEHCGSFNVVVNAKFNINTLEVLSTVDNAPYCNDCNRSNCIVDYNS